MYQKLGAVLLSLSLIGCTQTEEKAKESVPIEPGKPIEFHINTNNVKVTSDEKQVKNIC